ncbi:hypothetical protein [Roseovarius nanhaiticus]|uniref:hypothetical protein n=1 Tax=Roseovarius nanhaiticus TaxID=573024 RepID=UPI00248F7431|nr:hypothetical protein [Roseovarius nanhaiticus]
MGATKGQFNVTMLLERQFGANALGGFALGAEVGRTRVDTSLDGTIDRGGLSLGVYGAGYLAQNLILGGYAV